MAPARETKILGEQHAHATVGKLVHPVHAVMPAAAAETNGVISACRQHLGPRVRRVVAVLAHAAVALKVLQGLFDRRVIAFAGRKVVAVNDRVDRAALDKTECWGDILASTGVKQHLFASQAFQMRKLAGWVELMQRAPW